MTAIATIESLLASSDRVEIDMNDPVIEPHVVEIKKARVRLALSQNGIGAELPPPSSGSTTMTIFRIGSVRTPTATSNEKTGKAPMSKPKPKRYQHSYTPPAVAKDAIAILADEGSHIIQLVGPTGCGKTALVRYLGREMGRTVFQINCRGDMGSESFLGEKTIEADEATGQNVIVYQKGLLEQAMAEGLDKEGNEVGDPGILLVDEVTACPAHVAHVLNRFLESDDPRRTLVLDLDGGRTVRSHSGLRVIIGGNTVGRGAIGMEQTAYAAQLDALDLSFLSRVRATIRMGYDRKVEKRILAEKIGDDRVSQWILKYRDAIRGHIKAGKLMTPFTTRHIIDIADLYRIFGDLAKAIYYAAVEQLLPEEKALYNETGVAVLGKDLLKESVQEDVDYM